MRNALARLHRVRLRAEIVQADLDFAAVIAVDDTDTVRDMNALFDAETAASENEARRARGDLRRKTARKYAALARLDRLRISGDALADGKFRSVRRADPSSPLRRASAAPSRCL